MNLHFAGQDGILERQKMLLDCGVKHRLESFFTLRGKPCAQGFNLLLDSGGFSARTKGTIISVKEYADYVNKNNVVNAFNLDTNDVDETLENQKYLLANTKANIIPIFHYSDYVDGHIDLLDDFMRDFKYISVGGLVGNTINRQNKMKFLDYVFYKTRDVVPVHGLGITQLDFLKRYPFYSVDSTSWISGARFGNLTSIRDKNYEHFLCRTKHHSELNKIECKHFLKIQQYITELWESRGVVWKN